MAHSHLNAHRPGWSVPGSAGESRHVVEARITSAISYSQQEIASSSLCSSSQRHMLFSIRIPIGLILHIEIPMNVFSLAELVQAFDAKFTRAA